MNNKQKKALDIGLLLGSKNRPLKWPPELLAVLQPTPDRELQALALWGVIERLSRLPSKQRLPVIQPNSAHKVESNILDAEISALIISLFKYGSDILNRQIYILMMTYHFSINPLYRSLFWAVFQKGKDTALQASFICGHFDKGFFTDGKPTRSAEIFKAIVFEERVESTLLFQNLEPTIIPILLAKGCSPAKTSKKIERRFEKEYGVFLRSRSIEERALHQYLKKVKINRQKHLIYIDFDLDMPKIIPMPKHMLLSYFLEAHGLSEKEFRRAKVLYSDSTAPLYQKLLLELTEKEGMANVALSWSRCDLDWDGIHPNYDSLLLLLYAFFPAYQLPELPERLLYPFVRKDICSVDIVVGALRQLSGMSGNEAEVQRDLIEELIELTVLSTPLEEAFNRRVQLEQICSKYLTSYPYIAILDCFYQLFKRSLSLEHHE